MKPSDTSTVTTHDPESTPARSVIHGVVGVVTATFPVLNPSEL